MLFHVPKYQDRTWHLHLGAVSELLSETGYLKRLNKTQQRSLLILAYELGLAKRLRWLRNTSFSFSRRIHAVSHEPRKLDVPLTDVMPFRLQPIRNLQPHAEAVAFVSVCEPTRIKQLLEWASPLCFQDCKKEYWEAYSHSLLLLVARQILIYDNVKVRRATRQIATPFVLSDYVAAYLAFFEKWYEDIPVQRYVCRLAKTADEAALLTSVSRSTAAEIRLKEGVISL